MSKKEFNLISAIKTLLQWKKPLIILTFIAAIVSIIISLSLPDYFKSTVLFYASNPKYLDPTMAFSGQGTYVFGGKEDADRLISIGNSENLAFEIINKFHLYEHYDIDSTNTKFYRTKILNTFRQYIETIETPEGAIKINVYDKDRFLAADLANGILTKIDHLNKQSIRNNFSSVVELYKIAKNEKEAKIIQLKDSLEKMRREYNIYNPDVESELLTTELNYSRFNLEKLKAELLILQKERSSNDTIYLSTERTFGGVVLGIDYSLVMLKASIKGLEAKIKKITSPKKGIGLNINSFIEGAEVVRRLEHRIGLLTQEYSGIADQYNKTSIGFNSNFSSVFIIEKAIPADKKSKPIRSLIVLASTLITCFCSIFLVLFIEYYQKEIKELLK